MEPEANTWYCTDLLRHTPCIYIDYQGQQGKKNIEIVTWKLYHTHVQINTASLKPAHL